MKNVTQISFVSKFVLSILVITLFFSCQKEETTIIDRPNIDQEIKANSALTNLIYRITQNPTSMDNVLDKSSCVSVNLPVNIIINNELYTVGGTGGKTYAEVQNIINAFPTAPSVAMDFPISVTGQDYSTLQIASQSQMNATLETCTSNGLSDIRCAKILYPISIAMYNITTQFASTYTLNSNQQFYSFLSNRLNKETIANINYPIMLEGVDQMKYQITNNAGLEIFIRNAAEVCN